MATNSTRFNLRGHKMVFKVVKFYDAAGFIPSVKGISLDEKYETCARVKT